MPRSRISSLVTEKVLAEINQTPMQALIDGYADSIDVGALKNVCVKCSPALADDLDALVHLLGMTKRQFIEGALLDAIRVSEAIIREEGLHDINAERYQEAAA